MSSFNVDLYFFVQIFTHIFSSNFEFNHICAIKYLRAEHIGGFVHIDGADDEDILRKGYFLGYIFISIVPKFDRFARFHGAEEIGKVAFHHAEVHFVENQEIGLG